jgi:hypothetical protein
MGTISFTDDQTKSISEQIIQIPLTLNGIPSLGVTGLYDSLNTAIQEKADFQAQDLDKKIFFDNSLFSIQKYHEELLAIVGETRTLYNEADLISSAKHDLPHYDKDTWFNAVIEIIASNNGNPRNPGAQAGEDQTATAVSDTVASYTQGNTPASPLSTTLSENYVVGEGFIHTTGTGGSIGDIIIVSGGGGTMVGTITNITPPDGNCVGGSGSNPSDCTLDGGTWVTLGAQKVFFNVISGEQNFSSGAGVTNTFSAFTNAERGRQVSISPEREAIRDALEGVIDDLTDQWKNELNAIGLILTDQVNSGDNTAVSQNQAELDKLNAIIADIIDWEDEPIVDPNGKYTDAKLIPLIQDNASDRSSTGNPDRVAEINALLGSVAQDGSGNISGSGQYFNLTETIKSRADLVGGALASFFQADTTVRSIQQDIDQKESDLARYQLSFAVGRVTEDSELGQIEFEVDTVAEFSQGQEVKVMDNDSVVFTRNIDTIVGNIIRLDSGIPAILTFGGLSRIVRVK